MKYIIYFLAFFAIIGCTNLDETVYDIIIAENYYQTSDDIIRASIRSYEHGYWSVQSDVYVLQENTADQIATYNRQGHWLDGQRFFRQHYHTWTIDDGEINGAWEALFNGLCQANSAIDDFSELDPTDFGMTVQKFGELERGLRVLRSWYYIKLLDLYRNIPLAVSLKNQDLNTMEQVPPSEIFEFIEKELKEAIPELPRKASLGGNRNQQGQWTQAGAAALLVRLYLNAEKWIGTPKYTECAEYAQKIISGEYGPYAIEDRWDAVFDWNNETSDEVIFGFTGSFGRNHWHYESGMFWWHLPSKSPVYFGFTDWGNANFKYGLQPSKDIDENEYPFELGKPVAKFQKYPMDYRLKKYKNTGVSQREGMFLFEYLEYETVKDGQTVMEKVMNTGNTWPIYLRDQVGWFEGLEPGQILQDKVSNMDHADQNSGWCLVKYPFYDSNDPGKIEADYAEVRLAEIYYALAECKFRANDVAGAAKLLNEVRKRNYPEENHAEYLYSPDGNTTLTESELIDEWGREFIGEGRRRTDLCRWNKFTTGTWWDKQPDTDNHTEIFSLSRKTLTSNPKLKQNPGYDDVERN